MRVTLASLRGGFRIGLDSFLGRFGVALASFLDCFGVGVGLALFWNCIESYFGFVLGLFWGWSGLVSGSALGFDSMLFRVGLIR